MQISDAKIERKIFSLLDQRDGKTICPSEVARSLCPENWRPLMPRVRDVASKLVGKGKVVITQRGELVEVDLTKGPIRIGRRKR